jgi:hypothetical protein
MPGHVIRRKVVAPNPVQVGAKFGRLLVISDGWEQVSPKGTCADMVEVECDCGVKKFIRPRSLWPRGIKSCGCLQREDATARSAKMNLKHGHAGRDRRPEYGVYRTMLSRCYNPNVSKYVDYGGRGIFVCDRWRGDGGYENFIADMGFRPAGGSIERIDGNGPYDPSNCRWANATEQANNRRSNRTLEFRGRRQTLTQWARELGLNGATLHDRIGRGWPLERALLTPAI